MTIALFELQKEIDQGKKMNEICRIVRRKRNEINKHHREGKQELEYNFHQQGMRKQTSNMMQNYINHHHHHTHHPKHHHTFAVTRNNNNNIKKTTSTTATIATTTAATTNLKLAFFAFISLLLVLLICINGVHSLNCYHCSSVDNPGCNEAFTGKANISEVDCEKQIGRPAKVCRKIVQYIESKKVVIRSCGFIDDHDEKDRKPMCYKRSGTFAIMMESCNCYTDNCNHSASLVPHQSVLILLVIASCSMIMLCWSQQQRKQHLQAATKF